MIQRKQTVFLLIAALASVALFFVPFASFELASLKCSISALGVIGIDATPLSYLFIILKLLISAVIVLAITAIFLYKRRALQIRICTITSILNIFIVGVMFVGSEKVWEALNATSSLDYGWACYIPIVSLLLIFWAIRSIRKDVALLRSTNRLR